MLKEELLQKWRYAPVWWFDKIFGLIYLNTELAVSTIKKYKIISETKKNIKSTKTVTRFGTFYRFDEADIYFTEIQKYEPHCLKSQKKQLIQTFTKWFTLWLWTQQSASRRKKMMMSRLKIRKLSKKKTMNNIYS